jgi:methyl-accepting chemotaxis protein
MTTGTQGVSSNISILTKGAAETGQASRQVLASAEQLSHQAGDLSKKVKKFLSNVRATWQHVANRTSLC